MLKVSVRTVGASALRSLEGKLRRKIERKMTRALKASAREWVKLVISSTWYHKTPAGTDSVIAAVKPASMVGGRMTMAYTYGWLNYKGSAARAQWRLSLREWMHTPKVLERVRKVLEGAGNG